MAPGHLLLCHVHLGMLPLIGLGSHFYFWDFPGHVNAQGCTSFADILGSKGAGRPVHGVFSVHSPAGLTEPLGGMETFRSEALRGIEALGGKEGSWKTKYLGRVGGSQREWRLLEGQGFQGDEGSQRWGSSQRTGGRLLEGGRLSKGMRFSEGWRLSEGVEAPGRMEDLLTA